MHAHARDWVDIGAAPIFIGGQLRFALFEGGRQQNQQIAHGQEFHPADLFTKVGAFVVTFNGETGDAFVV